MFSYCVDPDTLSGLTWLSCYLTTGKHMAFYVSFGVVLLLLAVVGIFVTGLGSCARGVARLGFHGVVDALEIQTTYFQVGGALSFRAQ